MHGSGSSCRGSQRRNGCRATFPGYGPCAGDATWRQIGLAADVVVVRLVECCSGEFRWQVGRLQQSFERVDRVGGDLQSTTSTMDELTHCRIQRANLVVAEVDPYLIGHPQAVQPGHVTGSIFRRVPVVGAVLVDHLQADEPPIDLVGTQLLHFGDPSGSDPRPRAYRVQKEFKISHVAEAIGDIRSSVWRHPGCDASTRIGVRRGLLRALRRSR